MKVVIVEDERLTAQRLEQLLLSNHPEIKVLAILPSLESSIKWFKENDHPDLLFLDIQLNDGTGFDLLQSLEHQVPVIFTTAFDSYAVKAFKFYSIDYLLKPIDPRELATALEKFKSMQPINLADQESYKKVERTLSQDFKKRFLIKLGDQFQPILTTDIAYFSYDRGFTQVHCNDGRKLPIDHSLDYLEDMLNPMDFFRVNRQLIIAMTAIQQINTYFNSRLLLKLAPETREDVIVSRDRVGDFKRWMDS